MSFERLIRLAAAPTVTLSLALWGLSACTPRHDNPDDPKRRLNEYISQGFAVKGMDDRKVLLSYLTGEARTRLESWSEDQFRQAFIDSKRQFLRLAFKEVKNVSSDEVYVTYELTYQAPFAEPGSDAKETRFAKITNRKVAQLMHKGKDGSDKDKEWLIADVRNVREVVDYKDEMEIQAAKPSAK